MSAIVTVVRGGITMLGDTFQPTPRSRAAKAPVPSVALPPPPFCPSKFSALIERVCAPDSRERFPRLIPRPLKGALISYHHLRRFQHVESDCASFRKPPVLREHL